MRIYIIALLAFIDCKITVTSAIKDETDMFDSFNLRRTNHKIIDKKKTTPRMLVSHGVRHYFIKRSNPKFKTIKQYEREFLKLLSMDGCTYVYKRDPFWRTWREVEGTNGSYTIFYKCQSDVDEESSENNCRNNCKGGSWVVEDTTPCPYEFFSKPSPDTICAVKHNQLAQDFDTCSIKIHMFDLSSTCDNPVKTRWRFSKVYNEENIRGNMSTLICGKNAYCDITTYYEINRNYVVFMLLRDTKVIYSRLMANGGKNYACVNKCGHVIKSTSKTLRWNNDVKYQDKSTS